MVNPAALMKLRSHFMKFKDDHPKVLQFISLFAGQIDEGTVIELSIKLSDGTESKTNMKVNSHDLEMIQELKKALAK